jgi:hypothetical protein
MLEIVMVGSGLDNGWFVNFVLWQNQSKNQSRKLILHQWKNWKSTFTWTSVPSKLLVLVTQDSGVLLVDEFTKMK